MNYLQNTPKGKALVCGKEYQTGEKVQEYQYKEIVSTPNKYTVQIGENKHAMGSDETWAIYVNHSCNPNTFFNIQTMSFYARKNLSKGEEITFNYLTTEHDMREQFECQCGSENCIKFIQGNKYLTEEKKNWVSKTAKIE